MFPGHADGVGDGERSLLFQPPPQGVSHDEGHDVEEKAVDLSRVVQGQNVGVGQVGDGLDLQEEALGAQGPGHARIHHLHRHQPMVLQILGQVDRCHPALAQLPIDTIAVREGGSQPIFGSLA